ncbi:MAG: sulfatase-like hydrolase/transferase [Myxococcales bacterium]|nr:sulfatase-like hydrolase/transferase [Myxococcales bacterium]
MTPAQPPLPRRLWRALRPPLLLALAAFVTDLALAFRVSYMGVTDPKVSQLVVDQLLGTVVGIQLELVGLMLAVAGLMWGLHAGLLGLRGRAAWIGTLSTWSLLMVAHARRWPALYADLYDIRPIPDWAFRGVAEGPLGLALLAAFAGVTGALAVRALRDRPARHRAASAVGLALVGLLAWAAHRPPPTPTWRRSPSADPARPDVLLLMTDSWRADHFECRADSALTPRLGALCERHGRRHWKAYAPQPRTFGSVTALFTGLAPDESGVRHMMVRAEHRDQAARSLASRFRELGYRTVAVSGFAGDVFPRVKLGFETVDTPTFGFKVVMQEFSYRAHPLLFPFLATHRFTREHIAPVYRTFMDLADPDLEAGPAYDRAAEADPRPLFLTLFLSTTHSPYAVHQGRASDRGDDPVEFRYRHHPPAYRGQPLPPAAVDAVRRRYVEAVRAADDTLGHLAEQALAGGNTLVVITSDHGELLYEFGEANHGDHVFGDPHLAVPVVVLDGRADVSPAPPVDPAGLYALKDTLKATLQAVQTRQPVTPPAHEALYAESGIIIAALGPQVIEGHRLHYPEVLDLLEMDPAVGDMVVQAQWVDTVERGKFRAWITPTWTYVYSPGCKPPRMAMLPRGATAQALPAHSVGDGHPAHLEAAWTAMATRWGPGLVTRDCSR